MWSTQSTHGIWDLFNSDFGHFHTWSSGFLRFCDFCDDRDIRIEIRHNSALLVTCEWKHKKTVVVEEVWGGTVEWVVVNSTHSTVPPQILVVNSNSNSTSWLLVNTSSTSVANVAQGHRHLLGESGSREAIDVQIPPRLAGNPNQHKLSVNKSLLSLHKKPALSSAQEFAGYHRKLNHKHWLQVELWPVHTGIWFKDLSNKCKLSVRYFGVNGDRTRHVELNPKMESFWSVVWWAFSPSGTSELFYFRSVGQ